jgi:hypothetical protein
VDVDDHPDVLPTLNKIGQISIVNAGVMEHLVDAVKSALNAEKNGLVDLERQGWQPDSMPIQAAKSLIAQYKKVLAEVEARVK